MRAVAGPPLSSLQNEIPTSASVFPQMDAYTSKQKKKKPAKEYLPLARGFLGEMVDISFIIILRMF